MHKHGRVLVAPRDPLAPELLGDQLAESPPFAPVAIAGQEGRERPP